MVQFADYDAGQPARGEGDLRPEDGPSLFQPEFLHRLDLLHEFSDVSEGEYIVH